MASRFLSNRHGGGSHASVQYQIVDPESYRKTTHLVTLVGVALISPLAIVSILFLTFPEKWEPLVDLFTSGSAPSRFSTELMCSGSNGRYSIDAYPMAGPSAWENLTSAARDDFTQGGKIPLLVQFFDATNERTAGFWKASEIAKMVKIADKRDPTVKGFSEYKEEGIGAFFKAFEQFPVEGKSVLVIGSRKPWVEAICLSYGAAEITTVEFIVPTVKFPRLRALSIAELDRSSQRFDVVVSYSSLEHDGLGRYGDPINPRADLLRMDKIKNLLHPDGKLLLAVPNGKDSLVFNGHRIYGPLRFPQLIEGWTLQTTIGPSLQDCYKLKQFQYKQPLHVLSLVSS